MTLMRPETAVLSELLCDTGPVMQTEVAGPLLRALDLVERAIPAWITDPNLRADIAAGYVELSDDLAGGAR
ncbi:hypothetical protein OG875_05255 [Streptomyces sp. NBC_01498]|uniref:hypothetical protein n=1 Tax=Streptomyces sp. NBC_01498 TaxID=2975870 RepID=UPI002E7B2A9E|nr:hypothetical protein [Streptomyces sp. NBC_01498]WTL24066.1 hypothetical protein OG875_05255 [Streptomyces sp. NBC_01498]